MQAEAGVWCVWTRRGLREGTDGVGRQRRGDSAPLSPGMPNVFATLEAFGTELTYAGGPVGDDIPLLDWQVKGVGDVSLRLTHAGGRDTVARGYLLPGANVHLSGTGVVVSVM